MKNTTKFILLARQRTGSTVIVHSLDQHPEIYCDGEIFCPGKKKHHPSVQFPFIKYLRTSKPYIKYLQIPWGLMHTNSFLKTFFQQTEADTTTCVGFKLMLSQIKMFPLLHFWLDKDDIKKVVLVRDNALDILVSGQLAKRSGISHVNKGENRPDFRITLKTRTLKNKLRKIEQDNRRLYEYAADSNALLLRYENLFNWEKTMKQLQNFLNVKQTTLPAVHRKRSRRSLKDNIENFNEVASELSGSAFEKYLPVNKNGIMSNDNND